MSLFRRACRTVLPLVPLLATSVVVQMSWHLGPRSLGGKLLLSLGVFGMLALLLRERWEGAGPPPDVEDVKARYRRAHPAADGERVRLVIPVRAQEKGLPAGSHYLAFTDRTVTAFTYDRKHETFARLGHAGRDSVTLRGGRVVVTAEPEGRERRVLIPFGLRGDVEYWANTT
jgi:hypothetical protein